MVEVTGPNVPPASDRIHPVTWGAVIAGAGTVLLVLWVVVFREPAPRNVPAATVPVAKTKQEAPVTVKQAQMRRTLPRTMPISDIDPAPSPPPGQAEVRKQQSPGRQLTGEELFTAVSPAVVKIEVFDRQMRRIASGSGFLVSRDGLVATNCHVIANAAFASVAFATGNSIGVEGVAAIQPDVDLALLKIAGTNHPVLELSHAGLPPVGTIVYAIGSPLALENTLTNGIVGGHRRLNGIDLIQTSTPISPGSSGGPLLTADGAVVGVTTGGMVGGQNLNFAVPAIEVIALVVSHGGRLQTLAEATKAHPSASAAGRPQEAQTYELTETDIVQIANFHSRKATVFGVSLGMSRASVKQVIEGQRSLQLEDIKNSSGCYIKDGTNGKQLLSLTFGPHGTISQIVIFSPRCLVGDTKRLLTLETIDRNSAIVREFLGYPKSITNRSPYPETWGDIRYTYEDKGIVIRDLTGRDNSHSIALFLTSE